MFRACLRIAAFVLAGSLLPGLEQAQPSNPKSVPLLEVARDTVLDPGTTYGRLVIKASNITIDGRGAWLIGAQSGPTKSFKETAVSAKGVSKVTLKNINARGWDTGLKIEDGKDWVVENCNFSDNFHDPDYGWGEQGRRGGIVLERVAHSTLRRNKANRVWDACVLVDSNDNTLEDNDFSHTSNTCLKLWTSCRNLVRNNILSWGLRIKTGEVHARDSACVLVESGSNDNRLLNNDCTHGGDGVFIRVLNGWVSTGNLLEGNDASYAHNNCFEAQSPGNTYRRNKGNHGSHGFWLGISDKTILEDNEACYNGEPSGHHNAPFPFNFVPYPPKVGAGGIIFVGPCSHSIARGNKCIGNNGAGIALFGDSSPQHRYQVYHWIIEKNIFRNNRWGIYAEYADWIDMAGNDCEGNKESNMVMGGQVTNLTTYPDRPLGIPEAYQKPLPISQSPCAVLAGPSSGKVGQKVVLDASKSTTPENVALKLSYRWDLGDETILTQPRIQHVFEEAGFYRLGLTVNNGRFSDLAYRDFRVVDAGPEWGTEGQAAEWTWEEVYPRDGLHWSPGHERPLERVRPVPNPQTKVQIADDPEVCLAGQSSVLVRLAPAAIPSVCSIQGRRKPVCRWRAKPTWPFGASCATATSMPGKA